MSAVTVSSKYQIVIPKDVRESLSLKPGSKLAVLHYEGMIRLVPLRPMREMRGFLKGIDTTIEREPDRAL